MSSKLLTLGLLLGSLGLAAGCNYASKPFTIPYHKPDTASTGDKISQDSKTNAAGGDASPNGDQVIVPESPTSNSAISDFGSSPVPAAPEPAPAAEAPVSETPDTPTGDGVVDGTPEIGTPPLPAPVSCDTKNVAYVSKRGGVANVFVQRDANLTKVTPNDTSLTNYSHLEVRAGGEEFSADESTLVVIIPLIRSAFGSLEGPEPLTTLPGDGSFTRGFAWNHEGTKGAYFRMTPDRGHLSTAIHYVTNLETMETQRDMVVDPLGDYHAGQIAWWDNKLVVDFNFASGPVITVIDPERYPLYVQPVAVVGSESAALDAPKLEGSQPAVSKSGQLVFMRKIGDGRSALFTCTLQDVPQPAGLTASRQCAGLRIFNAPGNNDSPAFSPDGRWIYFVSDRDGNREIYRMHADGTGSERLTNDPAADESPAPFATDAACE